MNYTSENYTAPQYEVMQSILRSHYQPRFGHNNDFGDLLSDNTEQQKDYILGVLIGSIIIFAVALILFAVIIGLKIAGQDRVGFLAGRFVKYTPRDRLTTEDSIDDLVDEEERIDGPRVIDQTVEKRNALSNRACIAVRLMFVLSGIIIIVFTGIFYGKGVDSFRRSFAEVRKGIELVQNTANLGITITDTIIAEKEEMNQIMQANQVQNSTTEICGFNGALSNKIQEIFTNLSAAHEQLSSMVDESLSNMSDDLRSLILLTENVEKSLYNADIFFYIMIVVTCFLALLIVAMLIGVWFSAKNISNCFTKCITRAIIWPLFIFFLVLAWLFATVFLAVQLGGADFCVDPDMYVAQFLKNNMHMFEGPVLGILLYYISGCTTIAPGVEALTDIAAQIKEIAISSHELLEEIGEKSTQDIIDICGLSEMRAEALINLSSVLHGSIHALDTGMTGLRKIFACSTFNPIYVTVVHSAVCVESVSGLRYIFSSTMVISVFSSILVMLRAALYPVQEVTGDQHSQEIHSNRNDGKCN